MSGGTELRQGDIVDADDPGRLETFHVLDLPDRERRP
jgi:hypothetical protein